MTMHMVHPGLSTIVTKSKPKKLTPQQQKAKAEHDAWLRKQGLAPDQLAAKNAGKSRKLTSWKGTVDPGIPCSNGFADAGAKRSVFDSEWKDTYRDDPLMAEREAAALAKAEERKGQIMPLYNKGGYQLMTEGLTHKDLGKRRP